MKTLGEVLLELRVRRLPEYRDPLTYRLSPIEKRAREREVRSRLRSYRRRQESRSRSMPKHVRISDRIQVGKLRRSIREWARLSGIPGGTILARVNLLGWTPEEAVTRPLKRSKKHETRLRLFARLRARQHQQGEKS